jgi:NAD(P)H-dependent flavin oxidoreductase YrpB (nitropropane dioxygenase family)
VREIQGPGRHYLLGAEEVNQAVHSYGGIVLHDIIHDRHARKAIEKGADGLIAVPPAPAGTPARCRLSR